MSTVETLGQVLTKLREDLDLSQEAVAKAIGHTTSSTVSLWESDKRIPSEGNLRLLAVALGTTFEYLQAHGGAYNPNAPRMTRRQRARKAEAGRPDEPFPLRDAEVLRLFRSLAPEAQKVMLQLLRIQADPAVRHGLPPLVSGRRKTAQ